SAGKRAPVSRECPVPGGRQHRQLSAARLQKFDDLLWLHRRPASLRLSRGAIGEAFARPERRGSGGAPSGVGESGQAESAPMKAPLLCPCRGRLLRRADLMATPLLKP